jgi:hypothetical protein
VLRVVLERCSGIAQGAVSGGARGSTQAGGARENAQAGERCWRKGWEALLGSVLAARERGGRRC